MISGLGFIVGSQVAQAAGSFRWGLRVTPVLGIIGFLLVIFLVQDPPRGLSEGSRLRATNWAEDFKYLCGKYVNCVGVIIIIIIIIMYSIYKAPFP